MPFSKTKTTTEEREEMRKPLGVPLGPGTGGSLVWSVCWEHRVTPQDHLTLSEPQGKDSLWKCHCTGERGRLGQQTALMAMGIRGRGRTGCSTPEPGQLLLPVQRSGHIPVLSNPLGHNPGSLLPQLDCWCFDCHF